MVISKGGTVGVVVAEVAGEQQRPANLQFPSVPSGSSLSLWSAMRACVPGDGWPTLIAFTLVGCFVPRAYLFDMGVAISFGIIGYIARRTGYHVAAILIGIILGPLLENYCLRALRISQGDMMVLFSSTLGNVLWVALVLSLFGPAIKRWITGTWGK
jgi:TctA family transporter